MASNEKSRGISILPIKIQNVLKHIYSQKQFETSLVLPKTMHSLSDIIPNNQVLAATYHIDYIKNSCRTHWHLTLSETQSMSQLCRRAKCLYCPTPSYILTDLSDETLDTNVEGNVCFGIRKTLE
jgi:hypothetical protein